MAHHELHSGTILDQRYEVVSLIGRGGFARIYKAIQLGMGRPVALKVFDPAIQTGDPRSFAARFEQEAIALSRLRSPATVTVYDFGQTANGVLYMALEFVDGLALDAALSSGQPLEPTRVAHIMRQILESLREAHHYGILHRDIKPSNIMLHEHMGERDLVKLLDFGIARLFDDEGDDDVRQTREGVLIGTPRYMAPEAIAGEATPASDLYSFGLVVYELLTGKKAYTAKGNIELIESQLDPNSVKLPASLLVPSNFRAIVDRMLEKDRAARWGGADEIIEALHDSGLTRASLESHKATRHDVQASSSVKEAFARLSGGMNEVDNAATVEVAPLGADMIAEETSPILRAPPQLTLREPPSDAPSSSHVPPPTSQNEVGSSDLHEKPEKIIELTSPKRVDLSKSAERYSIAKPTAPLPDDWENVEDTNPSIERPREERLILLQQKREDSPPSAASTPPPEDTQTVTSPRSDDAQQAPAPAPASTQSGGSGKAIGVVIAVVILAIIALVAAFALKLIG